MSWSEISCCSIFISFSNGSYHAINFHLGRKRIREIPFSDNIAHAFNEIHILNTYTPLSAHSWARNVRMDEKKREREREISKYMDLKKVRWKEKKIHIFGEKLLIFMDKSRCYSVFRLQFSAATERTAIFCLFHSSSLSQCVANGFSDVKA